MNVEEDSRGEINGEEANITSLIHWCWSLLLAFESWMFVGEMSVHDIWGLAKGRIRQRVFLKVIACCMPWKIIVNL